MEEYVNNTGLMWELGASMGALLVFAEHRYEGSSVPDLIGMEDCAAYVTVEQVWRSCSFFERRPQKFRGHFFSLFSFGV